MSTTRTVEPFSVGDPPDPPAPRPPEVAGGSQDAGASVQLYSEIIQLIERLHRRFLDILRVELDRLNIADVNPVQALLIAELTEEVSVGDLVRRAYYLGSSANYNIKKLVEYGYLEQQPSPHDRRSMRVRPTEKGRSLCTRIRGLQADHAQRLIDSEAAAAGLEVAQRALSRLEQAWSDYIRYGRLHKL